LLTGLCAAQGAYFVATGVWPLVSLRTFEVVTGPKTDGWLVKVVGVCVAVIGAVLLVASRRGPVSPEERPEVPILAVGSAAGLGTVELFYALKGRISPIYLLDAAVEAALVGGWYVGWLRQARG
jgi:hypothetical protein